MLAFGAVQSAWRSSELNVAGWTVQDYSRLGAQSSLRRLEGAWMAYRSFLGNSHMYEISGWCCVVDVTRRRTRPLGTSKRYSCRAGCDQLS